MTRFAWLLTLALSVQVAADGVPNSGFGIGATSRRLRDAHNTDEPTAPTLQLWLWLSIAVSAAGTLGVFAACRFAAKQESEYRFRILPGEDYDEHQIEEAAAELESLSFVEVIMRTKPVLLAKGAGAAFRCIDLLLDAIAGVKFHIVGDEWWCRITFAIILLSPCVQYLYIKFRRGRAANALACLIPGSFAQLQKEFLQLRFVYELSQTALYQNVHKVVSTGTLAEVLAGIECVFESLPHAILQMRAYAVKGGDWVNRLSIAFSIFGVLMGAVFGIKAMLAKWSSKDRYGNATDVNMGSGDSVDLRQVRDKRTIAAVIRLASNDVDLIYWNFEGNSSVTDEHVQELAKNCKSPTNLNLADCNNISDDSVKEIAKNCKSLTDLDLKLCNITDDAVKEIAKNWKSLTYLNLSSCKNITDDSVKEIAKNCKSLTYLNLNGCKNITDDSVKEIAKNCKSLTYLNLSSCKITDDSVKEIAKNCKSLTYVNLSSCKNIKDDSVTEIANNCKSLTHLILRDCNNITDDAVKEILKNCKSLTYLNLLRCNNITDDSVKEIANNCKSLANLDLSRCNNITDDSVKEILKNCKSLTGLLLIECDNIPDDSVKEIAKNCENLTNLALAGCNNITDDSVKEIAKSCKSLANLTLWGCNNIANNSLHKFSNCRISK